MPDLRQEAAGDPPPESTFSDWGLWHHAVGSLDCDGCWSGFPQPCTEPDCTGLVHAEFEDESWDDYWLTYRCDRCGSTG